MHDIRDYCAHETRDADSRPRPASLRHLSHLRSKGTGRRVCLGPAAAMDHGTGLRHGQRPAVPYEGQLRRARRHYDERFSRNRADLRIVRATSLGSDRRRRACSYDGCFRLKAMAFWDKYEGRLVGARSRWSLDRCRMPAVPGAARPSGLYASSLSGNRRRSARSRHLPLFRVLGVPLRTLYGQTELLGAYTLHPADRVDPETTGVAMADDIQIRIDGPDA